MSARENTIRDSIAAAASEWFIANDEAPLQAAESGELVDWLTASPVHVEEFLGVAAVARDLRELASDPELSIEAMVALAQVPDTEPVRLFAHGGRQGPSATRPWALAAAALIAVGAAALGVALYHGRPAQPVPQGPPALAFATAHGEQKRVSLADGSVLNLNTDSLVTVRLSDTERLLVLKAGEAEFEVRHEQRPFKVLAGDAAIVDLGTRFDVRLKNEATWVTVLEGKVGVANIPARGPRIELTANQQIQVQGSQWPARVEHVDAQQTVAWLHRQIAFDHEPLERVAAEYNRYAPKPIDITAPELKSLEVSGTFSTDDPEELLAFLRSLDGVRVEVTATSIRVSPQHAARN